MTRTIASERNITHAHNDAILDYLENQTLENKNAFETVRREYLDDMYSHVPKERPSDEEDAKAIEAFLQMLLKKDLTAWRSVQRDIKNLGTSEQMTRLLACAKQHGVGHESWVIA